jgi:hypothetical protein
MLWWLSVAPLGNPVVPEVYWMLIGSPGLRLALAACSAVRSVPRPAAMSASHSTEWD